jgi:hypothetical protein
MIPPTTNERIRAKHGQRYTQMAGCRCVSEWLIDGGIKYFLFEADFAAVRSLVPERVWPVELRPGVAAVTVSWSRMAPGNLDGKLPAFTETLFCVLVQPDLSFDMPMPHFSFHVVRAGADSAAFLENEARVLHLDPMLLDSLTQELEPELPQVTLRDRSGPLFTLRNTNPNVVAQPMERWGQFTTVKDGQLYRGVWQYDGLGIEHQHPGDAGRVHAHPFYEGLNPETALGDCYVQLFARKGTEIIQRFFEPKLIGPV